MPEELIELAQDGIGVIAGAGASLPVEVAQVAIPAAKAAFIDAMNSGFWVSAGVMLSGAVLALLLLPRRAG